MPAFRIDFHHHCSCDPVDRLYYTDFELIDQAVAGGLNAIAITPHGSVFDNPEALAYAGSKGLLLIPGIEKMIEGYEIVLLNVRPEEIPGGFSFTDLRRLREKRGDSFFAFAPHPFYPRPTCAGPVLDRIVDLIDAVEYAHLYFSFYNQPNRQAVTWAQAHKKTVIANSDSHDLSMVGRNYSIIEATELTPAALFATLKSGTPELITRPYSLTDIVRFFWKVMLPLECHHLRQRFRPKKMSKPDA
jgi:predicted metal-dependent phosphoesterase TrpH